MKKNIKSTILTSSLLLSPSAWANSCNNIYAEFQKTGDRLHETYNNDIHPGILKFGDDIAEFFHKAINALPSTEEAAQHVEQISADMVNKVDQTYQSYAAQYPEQTERMQNEFQKIATGIKWEADNKAEGIRAQLNGFAAQIETHTPGIKKALDDGAAEVRKVVDEGTAEVRKVVDAGAAEVRKTAQQLRTTAQNAAQKAKNFFKF